MGFAKDNAVSSVVGTILIIAIAITAIATVLGWGLPYMQSVKEQSQVESVTNQLENFNDLVKEVCREGKNASTIARIAIKDGTLYLDSDGERFVIIYSMNTANDYNFTVSDLDNDNESFSLSCSQSFTCTATATWLNDSHTDTDTEDVGSTPRWFNFNRGINGMVRINLTNSGTLVGRIWVFDTGAIRYELIGNGWYYILLENGGIITANSPTGGYLQDVYYWKKGSHFALKMYQLNPSSEVTLSGATTYRFMLRSNGTYLRENRNETTYNFKIQVFGNFREAWFDYFEWNLGFKESGDTIYLPTYTQSNPMTFSLTQSVCDVSYEGIG